MKNSVGTILFVVVFVLAKKIPNPGSGICRAPLDGAPDRCSRRRIPEPWCKNSELQPGWHVTACYFKMLGKPPLCYIFLVWNRAACPRTCRAWSPTGPYEAPEELPVSAVLDHVPATNHPHSPSLEADNTYCEKWKHHNWNKGDSLPHKTSLPLSSTSCLYSH